MKYKEIIIPSLTIATLIGYILYAIHHISEGHPGLSLLKYIFILALVDVVIYCFSKEYLTENIPGKISLVISKFIQDFIIPLLFMFISAFLSMALL